jgi:hypothetical protein
MVNRRKRILSALVAGALAISLLPTAVLAEADPSASDSAQDDNQYYYSITKVEDGKVTLVVKEHDTDTETSTGKVGTQYDVTATLNTTAEDQYTITGLYYDQGADTATTPFSTSASGTFTMPGYDVRVGATLTKIESGSGEGGSDESVTKTYTVTVDSTIDSTQGKVVIGTFTEDENDNTTFNAASGSITVPAGGEFGVLVTPATGYEVSGFKLDAGSNTAPTFKEVTPTDFELADGEVFYLVDMPSPISVTNYSVKVSATFTETKDDTFTAEVEDPTVDTATVAALKEVELEENATSEDVEKALQEQNIDVAALASTLTAEVTDDSVTTSDALDTITALEESIGGAATPTVDTAMAETFDADSVAVVGATLNRKEADKPVTLEIGALEKPRTITNNAYKGDEAVHFSLELTNVATKTDGSLVVPVVITLPVPAKFQNPELLKVLHYHDSDTPSEVATSYDRAKGTISFVMTKFSEVALVESNPSQDELDDLGYYNVKAVSTGNGTILVSANSNGTGAASLDVKAGTTVYVTTEAKDGYQVDSCFYYKTAAVADGKVEIKLSGDTGSFEMPSQDVTLYATFVESSSSSGGSSGGGGGSSANTTTTGKTETVTGDNGVTAKITTDANGNITEASVTVPASAITAANGGVVTLPVTVPAATSTATAPAITISVPASAGTVKVEIPVTNVTSGCVAVIVNADGSETVVRKSTVSENGVVAPVSGTVTVKIIDNSKSFGDVASSYWAADYIAFVSSRELFQGTSTNTFNTNGPMTRQALMTVLARLDGQTADSVEDGMAWAVSKGISDGSNPEASISRQQLATMLYRYAGQPATNGSLSSYPDANGVASYATAALAWAVENGIVNGTTDGKLKPEGTATRAQVAAMVARYVSNIG